jgi:hypothetical protein
MTSAEEHFLTGLALPNAGRTTAGAKGIVMCVTSFAVDRP